MLTTPKVSDLARAEWQKLQAAKIAPTLDETAALLFWAGKVEHPDGTGNLLLEDARVVLGSDVLRPLSLQAEMWLEWLGAWADEGLMLLSTAFAAAVGRELGIFADLCTRPAAADAVANWARGMPCSQDELAAALEIIIPPERPSAAFDERDPEDDDSSVSMRDVLAELVVNTSHDAEWWIARTSDELLRASRAIHRREAMTAGAPMQAPDASAEAMRELLSVLESIRERAKLGG